MIGIMVIAVVVGYILLAKFIVTKVYKKTKGTKKANIALAIMILIPTWDVILGFPIYAYLCVFESGTKIYKTVDNVEGFYVGEKSISSEPIKPYEGYKYIDYKEKRSEKYYRSYWAEYFYDKEVADMCVYPQRPYSKYAKIFKTGKCIVKEEIDVGEVSRWEYDYNKNINSSIFLGNKTIVAIRDRKKNENIAENFSYSINQNWVVGFFNEIINHRGVLAHCNSWDNMLEKTLKQKGK